MTSVITVVEGRTDVPYAEAILAHTGHRAAPVIVKRGHGTLDADLRERWNSASNQRPMLVLRDIDPRPTGTDCAPSVVAELTGGGIVTPTLTVRLAVEELEAWVIADAEAAEEFFDLRSPLPTAPDSLSDPKAELVARCRKSRRREIREGMAPRHGSLRSVGPLYEDLLVEFARSWDPGRARTRSPSLARTMARIDGLTSAGIW